MKTDSQAFFLQTLADFLTGTKTTETAGVDWEEVFALARAQDLDGVVFHSCRSRLPREIKRTKVMPYLACAARAFQQEELIKDLAGRTEQKGIPLLFFKGAVIRDCYPVPALRTMGDVDFLVHREDRETVDRILREEMGCERFIDNHDVWTYWKGKLYLEAHTHVFYDPLANDTDYRGYFDGVWENARPAPVFGVSSEFLYVPDENVHFLYLMAHTAKHVTNKGSGFRPYLDMVLTARQWADRLDWTWIARELEELRLLEFTRVCFGLCERWFGVKMPLEGAERPEEFWIAATEKSFSDGVFGLANAENAGAKSARELKRSHRPRWLATLLLTLRKLFPPYEDLQLIPWYSFVDGRPWLTPAAWIYRWGYCLVHKRKHGAALLAEPFVKKDVIAKREKWLRQWGL